MSRYNLLGLTRQDIPITIWIVITIAIGLVILVPPTFLKTLSLLGAIVTVILLLPVILTLLIDLTVSRIEFFFDVELMDEWLTIKFIRLWFNDIFLFTLKTFNPTVVKYFKFFQLVLPIWLALTSFVCLVNAASFLANRSFKKSLLWSIPMAVTATFSVVAFYNM
jgi:hypothetical protein